MSVKLFSGNGQNFIHHKKNTGAERLYDMRLTSRQNNSYLKPSKQACRMRLKAYPTNN